MEERVGLVGLGRMGRFHPSNLAGRIPQAKLVRIVDADENVARRRVAGPTTRLPSPCRRRPNVPTGKEERCG